MAGRGRPKAPLVLSDEERETLVRWSRRAKSSQALAVRCRIVLGCAEDEGLRSNQDVAAQLGIWPQTVTKWRRRFLEPRVGGPGGEERAGGAREITDGEGGGGVVQTFGATTGEATDRVGGPVAGQAGVAETN